MRHVTWTESAQVRAKHAQINLHIYGPQVAVAATTLCQEPHSKGLNICFSFRHAPVQQSNHNIPHGGGKSCFPLSCFTAVAVVNPRSRNVVNHTSAPSWPSCIVIGLSHWHAPEWKPNVLDLKWPKTTLKHFVRCGSFYSVMSFKYPSKWPNRLISCIQWPYKPCRHLQG